MLESKFWIWFARIVTILGLITGSIAIYDYITKEEFTIEQTVDPETMERLRKLAPGEKITVEKGRPADESRSVSD